MCLQVVYAFKDEGGIAKMIANKLRTTQEGHWLLPFWREMGGQAECNTRPELHGAPGLLVSPDQVSPSAAAVAPVRAFLLQHCSLTAGIALVQGETWRVVNISIEPSVQATWLIEGALARGIEENTWLQVFRTTAGSIYGSMSPDDGLHWSPAGPLPLLNPNSKVRQVSLRWLLPSQVPQTKRAYLGVRAGHSM